MRKLISVLLLLTMLIPAALAETAETAPLTAAAPLSPELAEGGYAPNPDCFVEADEAAGVKAGYYDESLSITMERIDVDGVSYNVARVKIADASQLRTGLEDPKKGKKNNYVHNIAAKYNAVLAISSDFFTKNNSGYVIRMGETFRKKLYKNRDMLLIDSNGDFHIVYQSNEDDFNALMARTDISITNVFNFGPALVANGAALEVPDYYLKNNTFNVKRPEPRCAIGQVGPLEYLLVVADGRSDDSDGATGEQLAQFMAEQGCITAYNLDGGDTALMWFKDDYYSRKTKRSQSDIIYFATAVNPDAATEE
ncbi:MAG: phosphodiester glycosidase family protein [Clostridia bacterium]|nr:phosphodiester glycosidase family protein [Clostridia bacterium]